MKKEEVLELVRELYNKYDSYAISLHWNSQKVRFYPPDETDFAAVNAEE